MTAVDIMCCLDFVFIRVKLTPLTNSVSQKGIIYCSRNDMRQVNRLSGQSSLIPSFKETGRWKLCYL